MIKRFDFGNLFYKNKFVMGFSMVLSFILWCFVSIYISLGDEGEQERTITGVPIAFEILENTGKEGELKVFTNSDDENVTATVNIKGSRLVVGRVTKNDIKVVATHPSKAITSPGTYDMVLSAKKNSAIKNYSITSIVPGAVKVMVDHYKEQQFEVQSNIAYDVEPGYFAGKTKFSPSNISISGPDSVVSKIEKVVAVDKIDGILLESVSFESKIVLCDANNEEINSNYLIMSAKSVKTTIPIMFRKILPIKVQTKNQPSNYLSVAHRIKISPEKIEIAGSKKTLESLNEVKLSALDFSRVSLTNNSFDLSLESIADCGTVNENSNVKLTIDTAGLISRKISVRKFEVLNAPTDKNIGVETTKIEVEAIGPEFSIKTLKEDDLIAKLDLQGIVVGENKGQVEIPSQVEIFARGDCWIFGKYTAKINISKK
ncbi:MAG: hypothetical protein LBH37_01570 [Oscillospiraceae bacterium]|jgi:YbbR domain-containing protein|nr:hypothetical protein [Oscillospiraceae bacterium]